MQIRPMREGDLRSAERASAATFLEAEELNRRIVEPEAQPRSAEASALWIDRTRLFLAVDPGGCMEPPPPAAGTGSAPVRLCLSATKDDADRWWPAYLRRSELEHTFRLFERPLGRTRPEDARARTTGEGPDAPNRNPQ
ncbi:hypothetical protein [Streptomyces atratus]|uniref:hypothetical protein n=1 Tax=Streptomyces atratus TaxID=1893 RepID=UPI0021A440A0|nr:hypothetical protein [Streptomyces atratus]MCT2548151.1 hypothetical protein [Streptomyces atratus]